MLEEGCLSVPGIQVDVERPVHVRVRARDEEARTVLVQASEHQPLVIQHEMDYLDGLLILGRTSRAQRREAMRRLFGPSATPRRLSSDGQAGTSWRHALQGRIDVSTRTRVG